MQQVTKGGTVQDMEEALAAKTQVVEELSRELEEMRAAFGTEGVQQVNAPGSRNIHRQHAETFYCLYTQHAKEKCKEANPTILLTCSFLLFRGKRRDFFYK